MKKFCILSLAAAFVSCAPYLLYEYQIPEIQSNTQKATIVYLRSLNMPEFGLSSMAGPYGSTPMITANTEGAQSFIYVDGKYLGGLKNNCLTTFEVDSGLHLITSKANFKANSMIHAIPNRTYYIEEVPIPLGPLGVKPFTQPITKEEANQKMKETTYKFTKPNPKRLKDDLDKSEVDDNRQDWEKWAKDKPDESKKQLEYSGY